MRFTCAALLLMFGLIGCSDDPTSPTPNNPTPTLYITAMRPGGGMDVVRWREGMTSPEVIVADAEITGPPAKGKIVVTRWNGSQSSVILANEDGTSQSVLFTLDERVQCATLSPDAAFVAYTYITHTDNEFHYTAEIRPISGGSQVRVATTTAWENPVQWSPTANVLAYIAPGNVEDSLMVINADGSGRRLISLDVVAINDGYVGWSWTSDGRSMSSVFSDRSAARVVKIDASTGASTTAYEASPHSVVYATNSRKTTSAYYVTIVDTGATASSFRSRVAVTSTTTVLADTLDESASGFLPYYLAASADDAFLAYVTVDMTEAAVADPILSRSPVKLLRRSNNTVVDLGILGGMGYWN